MIDTTLGSVLTKYHQCPIEHIEMPRDAVIAEFLKAEAYADTLRAETSKSSSDPLLDAIRAYWAGLRDFNLNAPEDDDAATAYADVSYGPPLEVLDQWEHPATTLEGALTALQITLQDQNGVYGCQAAESMILAAIGYLEGLARENVSPATEKLSVEAKEHPWTKRNRLVGELSDALDECDDGNQVAYVLPARCKATLGYNIFFLMREYDGGSEDLQAISALAERHRDALGAWDAATDEAMLSIGNHSTDAELEESRGALLEFKPATIIGIYAKAEAMLRFRSIFEWDENKRSDLIRAFTGPKELQA